MQTSNMISVDNDSHNIVHISYDDQYDMLPPFSMSIRIRNGLCRLNLTTDKMIEIRDTIDRMLKEVES